MPSSVCPKSKKCHHYHLICNRKSNSKWFAWSNSKQQLTKGSQSNPPFPLRRVTALAATAIVDRPCGSRVRIFLHPSSVITALIVTPSTGITLCFHELLLRPDDVTFSIIPAASCRISRRVALLQIIASMDTEVDNIGTNSSIHAHRPRFAFRIAVHLGDSTALRACAVGLARGR